MEPQTPITTRKNRHGGTFIRRLSSWLVLSTGLMWGIARVAQSTGYWEQASSPAPTIRISGFDTGTSSNSAGAPFLTQSLWDETRKLDPHWLTAASDTGNVSNFTLGLGGSGDPMEFGVSTSAGLWVHFDAIPLTLTSDANDHSASNLVAPTPLTDPNAIAGMLVPINRLTNATIPPLPSTLSSERVLPFPVNTGNPLGPVNIVPIAGPTNWDTSRTNWGAANAVLPTSVTPPPFATLPVQGPRLSVKAPDTSPVVASTPTVAPSASPVASSSIAPAPAATPTLAVSTPATSIVQASLSGTQPFPQTDVLFASNFGGGSPPPLLKISSTGTVSTFNNGTNQNPQGIAFDSSNNLYVAYGDSSVIERFSITGTDLGVYSTQGTGSAAGVRGIAFDSVGNLYVANENLNTIVKIPVGGGAGTVIANSTNGLSQPTGLTFDSAGNLYVSEVALGSISKITFNADGSLKSINNSFVTGLATPSDLDISNGVLYVANAGPAFLFHHGVQGYSLSNGAQVFNQNGDNTPTGLASDNTGNLYATDLGGNIEMFTFSGGTLSLTSTVFATITGSQEQPAYLAYISLPEPTSLGLFLTGMVGLGLRRRRRATSATRWNHTPHGAGTPGD